MCSQSNQEGQAHPHSGPNSATGQGVKSTGKWKPVPTGEHEHRPGGAGGTVMVASPLRSLGRAGKMSQGQREGIPGKGREWEYSDHSQGE